MPWYNPASWFNLTGKAVDMADKLLDGTMSGLDKLIFTDQEKSEVSLKAANIYLEHQKVVANENTARSMTRRIIAVMIMTVFLSLIVFSVAIWKYSPEWAKFSLSAGGNLSFGFGAIIVFYYGSYYAGSLMDKKKGK